MEPWIGLLFPHVFQAIPLVALGNYSMLMPQRTVQRQRMVCYPEKCWIEKKLDFLYCPPHRPWTKWTGFTQPKCFLME